jgi:hypothetical protein
MATAWLRRLAEAHAKPASPTGRASSERLGEKFERCAVMGAFELAPAGIERPFGNLQIRGEKYIAPPTTFAAANDAP